MREPTPPPVQVLVLPRQYQFQTTRRRRRKRVLQQQKFNYRLVSISALVCLLLMTVAGFVHINDKGEPVDRPVVKPHLRSTLAKHVYMPPVAPIPKSTYAPVDDEPTTGEHADTYVKTGAINELETHESVGASHVISGQETFGSVTVMRGGDNYYLTPAQMDTLGIHGREITEIIIGDQAEISFFKVSKETMKKLSHPK